MYDRRMQPTAESVFAHAGRLFDAMKRYAPITSQESPIQELIVPSIGAALISRAKTLPQPASTTVLHIADIMTPPFKLSRKMIVHADRLQDPPTVALEIRGYLDEVKRRFRRPLLSFVHPDFMAVRQLADTHHDTLWMNAEEISLHLLLTHDTTSVAANSRLEMFPDGSFQYDYAMLVDSSIDQQSLDVADCVLRTVSVALYNRFGSRSG